MQRSQSGAADAPSLGAAVQGVQGQVSQQVLCSDIASHERLSGPGEFGESEAEDETLDQVRHQPFDSDLWPAIHSVQLTRNESQQDVTQSATTTSFCREKEEEDRIWSDLEMDWFGQDVVEGGRCVTEDVDFHLTPPCLSRLSPAGECNTMSEGSELLELVAAEIPLGLRDAWHEQLDVCQARLQALVKAEGSLSLKEAVSSEEDASEGIHRLSKLARQMEHATRDLEVAAHSQPVEEFPLNPEIQEDREPEQVLQTRIVANSEVMKGG